MSRAWYSKTVKEFLKDSNDYTYIDNSQNIEITYNSLGLQAGLRYYFFITYTT